MKVTKLWQGIWAMNGLTYRVVLYQKLQDGTVASDLIIERQDGVDGMGEPAWTRIEYSHPHHAPVTLLALAMTPIDAIEAVKAKVDGLALP